MNIPHETLPITLVIVIPKPSQVLEWAPSQVIPFLTCSKKLLPAKTGILLAVLCELLNFFS